MALLDEENISHVPILADAIGNETFASSAILTAEMRAQ
jgi:hypothetical protein